MSEGEMTEIRLSKAPNVTEDDYIKVLEHKTASLFEASARIGAILSEGTDEQVRAMTSFGRLLGIAYQIHDDLIDWNDEDKLFNMLVRQNDGSNTFIDRMEKLYESYAAKAKGELRRVASPANQAMKILEHLTDLAEVQF
jgi:octaprenyl-diphosphate synthase